MQNRNGFFGGDDGAFLILFLLLCGNGGWNGGWGNNAAMQGALTRAELYEGLNTNDIQSGIREIQSKMSEGFYSINSSLLNGFNGVQRDVLISTNNLQKDMMCGFNGVNAGLAQLGYNMQNCCCDIKTALHAEGEATRALIQENEIQKLRTALQDEKTEKLVTGLVTAQSIQTNNIENFIRQIVNGCGC